MKNLIILLSIAICTMVCGCEKTEDIDLSEDLVAEISEITSSSALISFNTVFDYSNTKSDAALVYGTSQDKMKFGAFGDYQHGKYVFRLSDLEPNTTYYFALKPRTITYGALSDDNIMILDNKTQRNNWNENIIPASNITSFTTKDDPVAIDLGLSVLWAKNNLGANSEDQEGSRYTWATDKYFAASTLLGTGLDAATVAYGPEWRMPSKQEVEELLANTTKSRQALDKEHYVKFTASNGNSIKLMAIDGMLDNNNNWVGVYWTNEAYLNSSSTLWRAYTLQISKTGVGISNEIIGQSHKYLIRPVKIKNGN